MRKALSVAVKEFQAAIRILEDAFRSLTAEGRPAATAPPLSRAAPLRSPRTAAQ